ncbi:hypothetical protein MHBO_002323 [Bonamia ostreae]|uniref:Protein kinase domain-containing protein n=1 Tax=Bonamia ostreae TaxID=126728 RepID=A0ABV2ALY5_9EUKA
MANPEIKFEEKNIKFYMKNLFEALYYLQEKCKVLHRDIKSSNILVGNDDSVKLGDFGLARLLRCDGRKHYTKTVVTLWYRAPELLFGESCYDGAVDIWSAGCVLAEMYLRKPLFPGNTEAEQIDRICSVVGTPSKDSYPEGLNFDVRCSKKYPRDFSRMKIVKDKSPLAFDLLTKILVLDPKKRLTAEKILDHDYFHIGDKAEPLDLFFSFSLRRHILPSHEFESQKRRRERREKTRNKKEKSKNIEPKEDLFDGEELKKLKEERLERENVQIESDSLSEFSSNDENVHSGSEPGEIVVQSD